ncbi:hypothetical protein J6590_100501 [Homalodisca vitripennis]|nr:hypothetical protein J6590_100501 [Homalodisca vitripennis]
MLERGTYSPLTQKASLLSKRYAEREYPLAHPHQKLSLSRRHHSPRKLVYYPRGMLERGKYPLASPLTQKASLLSKRYARAWKVSSSVTTHPES